jgi:hypothetical protein
MKDIVYIFRHGKNNDVGLKFSLRSLNNFPHNKVWIIGDRPYWLDTTKVNYIKCDDIGKSKTLNAWHKITVACNIPEISEDFVLFNDDFIVLSAVEDIPYYNRAYDYKNFKDTSSYFKARHRTMLLFESGMDFELHFPIVYNKEKFLALHDVYNIGNVYLHRSLYCNHYKIEGVRASDNKVTTMAELEKNLRNPRFPFVSLSDRVERRREFARVITPYFRGKSKYEK